MDFESLRRRCDDRLRGLDIPRPFDVERLCDSVARRRGRPIHLLPMRLPGAGPCGLWICGERDDYIVYQQETTPLHQEHIILHEIGHLVCGHRGTAPPDDAGGGSMFTHLAPETVRTMLPRTRYSSQEEREAEMLASLVVQRARRQLPVEHHTDPGTAAILARLEATMNPPRPARDG